MAGVEVQISVCVGWLSVDCYCYVFTLGLGEGVQEGDSSLSVGLFNGEFLYVGQWNLDIVTNCHGFLWELY